MKNRLLKTNVSQQYLNAHKVKCLIKCFYAKQYLGTYTTTSSMFNPRRSTKFVTTCAIQGNYKRSLRVFGFNRHLVRNGVLKDHFSNLKSTSW